MTDFDELLTLNEWMEGRTLFTAIQAIVPLSIPLSVAVIDEARMDRMLIDRFGERLVFPRYEELEDSSIAAVLVDEFQEKWTRMEDVYELVGSDDSRSTTETTDRDVTLNTSRNDVNQVSAFNSSDLLTDSGRTNSGTDTTEDDTTKTIVDTKVDINGKIWRLTRANYDRMIRTVLHDVGDFLTLSVY